MADFYGVIYQYGSYEAVWTQHQVFKTYERAQAFKDYLDNDPFYSTQEHFDSCISEGNFSDDKDFSTL